MTLKCVLYAGQCLDLLVTQCNDFETKAKCKMVRFDQTKDLRVLLLEYCSIVWNTYFVSSGNFWIWFHCLKLQITLLRTLIFRWHLLYVLGVTQQGIHINFVVPFHRTNYGKDSASFRMPNIANSIVLWCITLLF